MTVSKKYVKEFATKAEALKFYGNLQFSKNIASRTCSVIAGGNGACRVTYTYFR